jgi:hypothetical protein
MAQLLNQRQLISLKLESLSDSEVQELLDYVSIIESLRRSRVPSLAAPDDIVDLLAEARENRRARQAHEWEAVRRRAERRGAATPGQRM